MKQPKCGLACREVADEYGYGCDQQPCVNSDCDVCPPLETATFRGVEVPVTDPEPDAGASRRQLAVDHGLWEYAYERGTFQAIFATIFQEAFDLLVERQRKYGPENIKTQGIFGVFTRLSNDKIERLRKAMNGVIVNGQVNLYDFADAEDETVEDALLDVANYALIMLALKRGIWGRPLQEDL